MPRPIPRLVLPLLLGCGSSPEADDCYDGRDNDRDGLIDCEDGDCAHTTQCEEICGNEIDDDGDGAVDCGDDACFGEKGCPSQVGLQGGHVWTAGDRQYSLDLWSATLSSTFEARLLATQVEGTVQGSWHHHPTTCTWTLDRVSWEGWGDRFRSVFGSSFVNNDALGPYRTGFAVSKGCPWKAPSFLPGQLGLDRVPRELVWVQINRLGGLTAPRIWYPASPSWIRSTLRSSSFLDGDGTSTGGFRAHQSAWSMEGTLLPMEVSLP